MIVLPLIVTGEHLAFVVAVTAYAPPDRLACAIWASLRSAGLMAAACSDLMWRSMLVAYSVLVSWAAVTMTVGNVTENAAWRRRRARMQGGDA